VFLNLEQATLKKTSISGVFWRGSFLSLYPGGRGVIAPLSPGLSASPTPARIFCKGKVGGLAPMSEPGHHQDAVQAGKPMAVKGKARPRGGFFFGLDPA
jgi:hypothetical protein